jgi:hypothetical protein
MPFSREEIKKRMVELARKYVETHDPEIIKELYKLARELEKLEKEKSNNEAGRLGLKHAINCLVPGIGRSLVNPFLRSRKTCFHGVIVSLELLIHWKSHEYMSEAFAVVNEYANRPGITV